MVKHKGIWICVSGIDGSGKTTVCKHIMTVLGKNSKFMKIPYFDWVRDMIKISGNNSPTEDRYTDALIFAAGSRLEMYYIDEFLGNNKYLVTQRCWLDNFPYRIAQGYSLKEAMDILRPEQFIKPDVIFFLKYDYRRAYEGIKNDNGDKYETLDQIKIHEMEFDKMYDDIRANNFPIKFPNTKIVMIDTSKPLNEVKKEVTEKLEELNLSFSEEW